MTKPRRRLVLVLISAAFLVALVVALGLFQPWRLFTSSSIDEPLADGSAVTGPAASAGEAYAGAASAQPVPPSAGPVPSTADTRPTVLAAGQFQSQEHSTSGSASLIQLPDGAHVIRLENLASSDGPDVKVWLSDREAGGDWYKYRSGKYLDLGPVKATHGNQNYAVPPGTDLTGLKTVVLWCDRFSVAFGSAALG
ncbi:DM13 domain-containing protein [Arthrobacter sp. ISL-72]|uniref:DM13 domain-containing protein n=1 Tax=Arthrobacter sp. ISL-72 TaxID=2819114 RepID=UPI001BEBEB21|nr:DM13 domain-containing protein [Arthrobacter sp. ISL-72]MBT2595759.1 DM13 domain-containing protein [Arthrobacter sp. ISL-72]